MTLLHIKRGRDRACLPAIGCVTYKCTTDVRLDRVPVQILAATIALLSVVSGNKAGYTNEG